MVACNQQRPGNRIDFVVMKGQSNPRSDSVDKPEPNATLNEREIREASHWAMFLTIPLRDKDGTPWQGDA